MDYEAITYETDDRIGVITFNRPRKMNAFSFQLVREFTDAISKADADDNVRAIVVKGAGGKAFSSGFDLTETAVITRPQTATEWRNRIEHDCKFMFTVWNCSKPVIAMIEGYCLGGAVELIQMCDVRYCSDDSQFAVVETRFSSGSPTLVMPWIIGARSRELIFTGDKIGAAEALRLGLVNRVFPKADLRSETMKSAKRMSQVALDCLRWNKRAINYAFQSMGLHNGVQYGVEACSILDATMTPEYQQFNELRKTKGLAAAMAWRDEQFAQFE
jgi:enoyl-CoA hydratase/carnithine racemase